MSTAHESLNMFEDANLSLSVGKGGQLQYQLNYKNGKKDGLQKAGIGMDNVGTKVTTKMASKMVCRKVGMRMDNLCTDIIIKMVK